MEIKVKVKNNILRSKEEVFDAIINPDKINKYFASKAVGKLDQDKKIKWLFEDVGVELEVDVLQIEKNKLIAFQWGASGISARVDIKLETGTMGQTDIEITEGSFEMDELGVQKAMQQTQGWTDFICSMKAYLYTGINLRNGRMKINK